MVTSAFLLFTVSTLAAQINGVPTNLSRDPCEGKTYCFEKPADYPQEEIDRILLQSDLHHLHRIKREAQMAFSYENNDCVESVKKDSILFIAPDEKGIARHVVQSVLYSQWIPKIKCNFKQRCFERIPDGKNDTEIFECEPVQRKVSLSMYNREDKTIKKYSPYITTGCLCAKQD